MTEVGASADTVDIEVGQYTFTTTVAGPAAGEPVLLLHGFPQSRAAWSRVIPRLTDAGLRVIAPDQRGYSPGACPTAVDDYRIEHLVADVIGLLDHLGLQRAHVVGHDWGAIVAWFVAVRHPDRVSSLTALSVPHPAAFGQALASDSDQQEASSYMRLFRSDRAEPVMLADGARRLRSWFPDAVPAELVEEYLTQAQVVGALTSRLNWYRAMTSEFGDLGPVTVPTTYVWGAGDLALRRRGAELCHRHVDAHFVQVTLPGVGHWIPEVAPDEVADAVLRGVGQRVVDQQGAGS